MSPIDCEEVLRELELFLDGEIDRALGQRIEEHLGTCSPCVDRAEFRRRVRQIIAAKSCQDELPPDLLERVRAALEGPA